MMNKEFDLRMSYKVLNFFNKKYVRYFVYALFLILLGIAYTSKFFTMDIDSDSLWHYKLGEDIVRTMSISTDNPYTFLEGTEWVSHEWLYEVIFYLIINAGGFLAFCLMYAINKIFTYVLALKLNGTKNYVVYTIVFIFVMFVLPMNSGNRPSEFSVYFILFMFYLYWNKSKYKILWYIPLAVFIANFHGGFIIMMIAIDIILLLFDLIVDIYEHKFQSKKYYGKQLLCLIVFVAACCINPSGPYMMSTIFKISGLSSTKYISEWQPLQCGYVDAVLLVFMLITFGYALHRHKFERKIVQLVACLSALLVLTLVSRKAGIIYTLVWLVFGFQYFYEFMSDILLKMKYRWCKCDLQEKPKCNRTPYVAFLMCIMMFWLLVLEYANSMIAIPTGTFMDRMNASYSQKIMTELKDNYTDDTRILTGYNHGNIILANDMKCFVDSRQWCYAKELGNCTALDDLSYIVYNKYDVDAIDMFFDKYDFDYVWVSQDLLIASYMDSRDDYELVVTDDYHSPYDVISPVVTNESDDNIYDRNVKNIEYLYRKIK